MNSTNREILRQLRTSLDQKVDLYSLTLFGSRVREDFDQESDMDVLVVVNQLDAEIEKTVSKCAWQVGLEHGVLIVPVTYLRDDWENGPESSSLLAIAVRSEGIPV